MNQTRSRARQLLRNPTDVEHLLWRHLRFWQLEGYKFRRQQPLGIYILDFVCLEKRLVIELDGGQHAEQTNYDSARDAWLSEQGFSVLRFWNNDVLENVDGVIERIFEKLKVPPSLVLPRKGEGKRLK